MTETRDAFLGGRLHLWQPARGFRSGSDAVLLAAAVPALAGQSVLDLGCGVGAAMYCLGARVPDLSLTGIEREAVSAALARRNGAAEVLEADVLSLPKQVTARQWDHVLTNPPYFEAGAGTPAQDTAREAGLREDRPGGVARWAHVACKRVKPKGTVTMIVRAERLADILTPLDASLGAVVVLPISAVPGQPAKRVIVQGRKGARAPLRLLPPLVLHHGDGRGGYRPEADDILRGRRRIELT